MIESIIGGNGARSSLAIVAALLVLAALFRLPGLGGPGFYGDEETTAHVARSVAEGGGLHMPSGLPYYRAAPLTLLNGLAAKIAGPDGELGYRIPAAILGIATPAIFFLMARMLVPTGIALAAAVLLVFSEWHVITSREARMYAPFMLCFMATGLLVWHWAERIDLGKFVAIAVLIAVTSTLNNLGLLAALFPVVWLCLQPRASVAWRRLLAIVAVAPAFYFLVGKPLIFGAFIEFRQAVGDTGVTSAGDPQTALPFLQGGIFAIPWLIGALPGAWLGWRVHARDSAAHGWINKASVISASAVAGAALVALHFHAAALAAAAALLLYRGGIMKALEPALLPLAVLLAGAAAHFSVLYGVAGSGMALKDHFLFPYPYFFYFWQYSPGLFLLFWAGVAMLVCADHDRTTDTLKAAALITIGILGGVGVAMKWGGMRYLIGAYPFMLLVACYPLYRIFMLCDKRGQLAGTASGVVIAATILGGLLGGHGIGAAQGARNLSPGDETSTLSFGFPLYPDHQGAGDYVKRNLGADDIVIAADALQQYWYVGRVTYWLTDLASSARFAYKDRQGALRDIYVNSELLLSPERALACAEADSVTWVITSAEMSGRLEQYLSEEQRAWLSGLEDRHAPAYTGRDGETIVYRLPCD